MAPETIAGRYHVERAVGRGGMGTVWLCRDEVLGRPVAVKEVGTFPGEGTPDLARALREARSSAALNHRNVVSIYDAVEDGDQIWLVMEYVPSRTLSQVLAEDGPLTPERAAWIGAQVADGLAAAHERRTIHRDVKPGNILVTDDDLAKVSDFGIARTHGDATLTGSGLVTGTPTYFAPELARGAEPSPAADVWALGATLFAAVEGHPPYPAQTNPIATLAAIADGHPPRPERAGLLTTPISHMLDPDLASRWSMTDAADALHRLHENGPHEARAAADATAVFAAPAGAATPEGADVRVDEPDGSPAPLAGGPGRGRDRPGWLIPVVALVLLALVVAGALVLLGNRGSERPTAGTTAHTTTPSPSDSGSSDASASHSPSASGGTDHRSATTQPSATTQSSPPGTPAPAGGGASGQRFVESYYANLPGNTRKGWSLLAPSFHAKEGSYGNYRGFWSGIDSVQVRSTKAAGKRAVDVSLAYTKPDGSVDTEVRRIFLERSGGGYLIASDEVIG